MFLLSLSFFSRSNIIEKKGYNKRKKGKKRERERERFSEDDTSFIFFYLSSSISYYYYYYCFVSFLLFSLFLSFSPSFFPYNTDSCIYTHRYFLTHLLLPLIFFFSFGCSLSLLLLLGCHSISDFVETFKESLTSLSTTSLDIPFTAT